MTFQVPREEGLRLRREYLDKARRVVVKIGSAVLTTGTGLNLPVLQNLTGQLSQLRQTGREVVLVSSGAVAAGKKKLQVTAAEISLKEKQAIAAVGQSTLMRAYEDSFGCFDQKVAQILLTHNDLTNRSRYLNARNTLFTLLNWHILPVINENDTVSVEELRFGDNDALGAMVTNLIEADIFICLTDVAGLYTANPSVDSTARLVYTVANVNKKVEAMAGYAVSVAGTGGMHSKIMSAKMVAARGGCSFIGPGRQKNILQKIFAGEPVGTFFLPKAQKLPSRKHWLAYTLRPKGFLVLDDGACRALTGGGKSLLPSGIIEVQGKFRIGTLVHCLDQQGRALAAGLVSYSAADIERIRGMQTVQIIDTLGYKDSDEVIHRDNLVIL